MKNKTKKYAILFPLFVVAGIFNFAPTSCADSSSIVISAVQTGGSDSDDDFIELYNPACDSVGLAGWKLKRRTKGGSEASIGTLKNSIPAKGYYLWENISGTLNDAPDYATKTYYLSNDYSLALFDKSGNQIDSVTWGSNTDPYKNTVHAPNPEKSQTLKRNGDALDAISAYPPKNSSFTEEDELKKCPKIKTPAPMTYSKDMAINEILPDPASGQDEFIELYNPADGSADLSDWILRDGSKTGRYIFPKGTSVKSKGYLVVYKSDYKFALNNSGAESVTLFSPDGQAVSAISYDGAKENLSYGYDGQAWRWSKFLTPGKKNKFGKPSRIETEVEEKIYVGIYADFQAKKTSSDRNKIKYTWDFGDSHKSYQQNTRHKYEKPGKYTATLETFDGSEDKLETFKIKVEKFPKFSVKIIALSPNPKGKDKGNEWVEIENNYKKKINLKGWSLATGNKKLQNHKITDDLFIKPGQTLRLTYADCKFSLNNKSSKVELRYPNGKTASHVKYAVPGKSVPEDAVYEKTRRGWFWKLSRNDPALAVSAGHVPISPKPASAQDAQKIYSDAEIKNSLGKYSADGSKKDIEIKLLSYSPEKELPIKLAREKSLRNFNDVYYFSKPTARKHWAVSLVENIFAATNNLLNRFVLSI